MPKIKAEILDRMMRNDPKLKSVDLTGLGLEDSDIAILVGALQTNTHLNSLDVSHNKIGVEGAKALASNTHLTSLIVRHNNIGVEGAKALANNTHLISLYVCGNNIGDEGAKFLASNTHLTSLYVIDNKIGDEGAKVLASNTHLISLSIDYINWPMKEGILQAIHLNKKARELIFIEQVTEVAKGARTSQASRLKTLPTDILLIILSYVAGNSMRNPKEVTDVCKILLEKIKSTSKGKLNWNQPKTKFFKAWDEDELRAVNDRAAKQTVKQPESSSPAEQQTSGCELQ